MSNYDYLMAVADDVLALMLCAVLSCEIIPEDFVDLEELGSCVRRLIASDKWFCMTGISSPVLGVDAEECVRHTHFSVINSAMSAGWIEEDWISARSWSKIDTGLRLYVLNDAVKLALDSMGVRNLYRFAVEYQSVLDGYTV